MHHSALDIDWIVAEVVRRLENQSGGRQSLEPTAIADNIITLQTLNRFNDFTELTIAPRAIITPAARDELKKRNIRLVRAGAPVATSPPIKPAAGTILAANLGTDYNHQTLARLVSVHGATCETHPATALPTLIADHAARVVRDQTKAVWFTRQAAQAVCLANRCAEVWAVQGLDEKTIRDALQSLAANVLVIDPQGKSQYTLRRMLNAFVG